MQKCLYVLGGGMKWWAAIKKSEPEVHLTRHHIKRRGRSMFITLLLLLVTFLIEVFETVVN